jgi:predicted  nucleic acid-binding Zn-ribbon protein
MPNQDEIARQVELMHLYHLDLWTEIEAQLRTLRASQAQIEKLRSARTANDTIQVARSSAHLLSYHVDTLKGRVGTLDATIAELAKAVAALRNALGPET